MKEGIIILEIRRIEVDKLRERGYGKYVKKTYSDHPTYFVVEERHVLKFIEDFRLLIRTNHTKYKDGCR